MKLMLATAHTIPKQALTWRGPCYAQHCPRSGHLQVKAPREGEPAWKQLVIHAGRGGGLKPIRESLKTVALELKSLVEA